MIKKIKLIAIVIISLFWIACDPGYETVDLGNPSTCEGCHTSQVTLETILKGVSDTEPSGGG